MIVANNHKFIEEAKIDEIETEKDLREFILFYISELYKAKYSVDNLIPESWSLEKQTEVMRGEKVKNPNT